MAEGTPLERVQVVNSGARVQIPPSPFVSIDTSMDPVCRTDRSGRDLPADRGAVCGKWQRSLKLSAGAGNEPRDSHNSTLTDKQ